MSVSLINRSGFFAAKQLEAKNAARPAPKPSANILSFSTPKLKPNHSTSAMLNEAKELQRKQEVEAARQLASNIAAIKMGLFSVPKMAPKQPKPMPSHTLLNSKG